MGWESKKRGQVTLFVILALLIAAGAVVYFLYAKPEFLQETNVRVGFEGCVQDAVETSIDQLALKAGYAQPEFTYSYAGYEYTYLCYTADYYETCVIQQPFIKQHFEDQLTRSVKEAIKLCYTNSLDELQAQGHKVTKGELKQEIYLEPNTVRIEINAPTTVGSNSFKTFNILLPHPIYNTISIATSIIQHEAHYGDSETTDYLLTYQDYTVDKWKQSDGTTLYTIQNKLFNTQFRFASRSLAWPPGITIQEQP